MPDDIGRMNFGEMREAVWRALAALYPSSVDPTTGEEAADPRVDPLFTKNDLDRWINEAVTMRFLDLIENADKILLDEEFIDVEVDIVEYALPTDMAFLRGLYWKDPSVPISQMPFNERQLMFQTDEGTPGDNLEFSNGVPTYRRQLDNFVLNQAQKTQNLGGICIRYVKWANHLIQDDQILETVYAKIIQELVIIDAAIKAASRKAFLDTTALKEDRTEWENRLAIAARMSDCPPFMQMVVHHPVRVDR